jgi:hypothetical protein
MPSPGHQPGIDQQAVHLYCILINSQALARVALHVVRTTGDKGNTLVPMRDQVSHCLEYAAAIVSRDRGAALPCRDEDQRVPGCAQFLQVARSGFGMQGIDGDDTVGVLGADGHKVGVGRKKRPRRPW